MWHAHRVPRLALALALRLLLLSPATSTVLTTAGARVAQAIRRRLAEEHDGFYRHFIGGAPAFP